MSSDAAVIHAGSLSNFPSNHVITQFLLFTLNLRYFQIDHVTSVLFSAYRSLASFLARCRQLEDASRSNTTSLGINRPF